MEGKKENSGITLVELANILEEVNSLLNRHGLAIPARDGFHLDDLTKGHLRIRLNIAEKGGE